MNKKKLIIGFGMFLLLGIIAYVSAGLFVDGSSNDASVSSLQKGLVGHWSLDGVDYNSNTNRVTDKSAYSNHGTNSGATLTIDRMGNSEGAMSFDGNDWVQLDGDIGVSGEMTLSFWFYTTNKDQQYLFDNRDPGSWWFIKNYGGGACSSYPGNLCFESRVIAHDSDWDVNTWNHVVVTDDTTTAKMYINGVLVDEGTGESTTISTNFRIGTRYTNSGYLEGSMDNVRVYNRVLSEEEIKLLYDSYQPKVVSGSTQKGLILDMPLSSRYTKDETAGSEIITDRTPYSNDGQNYGATLGSDSASFDGTNDYVKVEDVVVSNPSELTISGWIKKESGGHTYECALHHGSDSSIGNSAYWFGVDNSDYLTATIGARTGVGWAAGKTSVLVNYGEWYHLTASWDGSVVRVYINGDYSKQYNLGTYSSLTTPTRMGASTDGTNYQFKGDISNVKIYNRALSAEEIKSLYDKGRY